VQVTNGLKFSYPGYNEMLVGNPDPRIDRNTYGPNPNVTVFERLNHRREFRGRVAAFGTWDTFRDIFNVRRSRIYLHTTGNQPYDGVVQRAVVTYLERQKPRAVFVAYAETDDWAHQGRYDRFLDAAHAVDAYLAQLWSAVQADPRYRGKTTLIFTADHGRGRTPGDWMDHGEKVVGAEETFIVMIGPQAEAAGERRNTANVEGEIAGITASAVGLEPVRPRVASRAR
jgi:phosphopentomutase